MLSEVAKKYETFKKTNQKSIELIKQSIQKQMQTITIQALKVQNHKVSKIHSNQQQIQNRLRKNNQLQSQLKLHLGGWVLLYDQLNKSLKQAGDVVNYAKYVEEEIRQMNTQLKKRMLQQIKKDQQEKEAKQIQKNQTYSSAQVAQENVQKQIETNQNFNSAQIQPYEPQV